MKKYVCTACGYVYDPEVGDPENGVPAGTAWEDVPEDWACPLCALGKDVFEEAQTDSLYRSINENKIVGIRDLRPCFLFFFTSKDNIEFREFKEIKRQYLQQTINSLYSLSSL